MTFQVNQRLCKKCGWIANRSGVPLQRQFTGEPLRVNIQVTENDQTEQNKFRETFCITKNDPTYLVRDTRRAFDLGRRAQIFRFRETFQAILKNEEIDWDSVNIVK